MTTDIARLRTSRAASMVTTRNKVGLGIAAFLGLVDCASLAFQTPEGEVGPPISILVLSTICGVLTVAAVVPAWRSGNRVALRVAAGTRIVSALTSLPALFVDLPVGVVALTALSVALTVVSLVLMMTAARSRSPIED